MELDRRKKSRRPVNLLGHVRVGKAVAQATTTDLSATGAFLATKIEAAVGQEIELRLQDAPGPRRALRLIGTVARVVAAGQGPLVGFGVVWRAIESAAGVEPLGTFLIEEMAIEGAAIRVSVDGRRARYEFPAALPATQPAAAAAARPGPPKPTSPRPLRPSGGTAQAAPARSDSARTGRAASVQPEAAREEVRPVRVRRPTQRMQRPGPAPVQQPPIAARVAAPARRTHPIETVPARPAAQPGARPVSGGVQRDETELVGLGGAAFFNRMATVREGGASVDVPERTSPEVSGVFEGVAPKSASFGRRLLSATGRLFGRGEEEQSVDVAGPGQSSGGWLYEQAESESSPGRPVSGIFAGGAARSAPAIDVPEHSRGARAVREGPIQSRLPEVIPPKVDVKAMVEVSLPATYYMNDLLIPAQLRRMGPDGMVIDTTGSVPFIGTPTDMNVPMWLGERFVTLRVRMVPCIEPRLFGRVQRFVAAVLDVDDRHGVGMAELLAAETVVREAAPGRVVE